MRLLTQAIMNELFEVLDEYPLSREAVTVPLVGVGEGDVRRLGNGKVEITLPEAGDLEPFLAALPQRLRQLGVEPEPF
jgi:hypothetical protein